MMWLIETQVSSAWKTDAGHHPPASFLKFSVLNSLVSQQRERARQVLAHHVDSPRCQVLPRVFDEHGSLSRVDAHFGRWQREDHPPVARIDRGDLEHVAEERAVGF